MKAIWIFFVLNSSIVAAQHEIFDVVQMDSNRIPPTSMFVRNIEIVGTKTWDQVAGTGNPSHVTGVVTILDGATLTIDGKTIEFGYGKTSLTTKTPTISGIIVKPGGKLIVKNSTLKGMNTCNKDHMWDGIAAESAPGTSTTVTISTNSFILDAVRGVVSGSLTYEMREIPYTLTNGTVGKKAIPVLLDGGRGGANIGVSNSTFRNCGKAIVWNKPAASWAYPLGYVSNTTFECTGSLRDPTYLPTFGIGEPLGTEVFCEAREMRSVSFSGCTFKNTAGFSSHVNSGVGIYTFQTKLNISGGTFENLLIGAEVAGGPSGITNHFNGSGVTFTNVFQSLNLRNNTGSTVKGCTFTSIPNNLLFLNGQQIWPHGLFCDATKAVAINNNQFYGGGGFFPTGLIARNTGSNGGSMAVNYFGDFAQTSSFFKSNNSQFDTRCNTYEYTSSLSNGVYAWYVDGVMKDQGTGATKFDQQPDNKYKSNCVNGGGFDIYSNTVFNYYEKPLAPDRAMQTCSQGVVISSVSNNTNTNFDCAPAFNCIEGDCTGLESAFVSGGSPLTGRNVLLNSYLGKALTSDVDVWGQNKALNMLTERGQQADMRLLIESRIGLGEFAAAQNLLANVSGLGAETTEFSLLASTIINAGLAGRGSAQLNSQDWSAISSLLTSETEAASVAKNLDFIGRGHYHALFVNQPITYHGSEKTETKSKEPESWAAPNPFEHQVSFGNRKDLIKQIDVFDATGRLIWHFINPMGTLEANWTPADNAGKGLYFYKVLTTDGNAHQGKVIFLGE